MNTLFINGVLATSMLTLSRIHVTEAIPTEQEKLKIFQEMHMKPTGHLDMNKTYERMKLFTTWPGMKQEIDYIKKCEMSEKQNYAT